MDEKGNWYSNQEIFEMIQSLKDDLRDTQEAVRRYNGLIGRLAAVEKAQADADTRTMARVSLRASIEDKVLRWGGWVVGLLSLALTWWRVFASVPK